MLTIANTICGMVSDGSFDTFTDQPGSHQQVEANGTAQVERAQRIRLREVDQAEQHLAMLREREQHVDHQRDQRHRRAHTLRRVAAQQRIAQLRTKCSNRPPSRTVSTPSRTT